jgi:hypothetical protein
MPFANLPARGERSAPTFDDSQPEELERYFADLQALFDRHTVNDENERKLAALKYLKFRTESLWKTTDAWTDQTKTYDEFKAEVYSLYPGATGDRTYTMQDLDAVIGHYARIGIVTAADLGEYYRKFLLISRYLISKNRLATQEQSRTFFRGLQPQLEGLVRQRLQQKFIDHFPDDPYELSAIYEAVSYVLMGNASATLGLPQTSPNPPSLINGPDPTSVKIEALAAAVASLGEMFKSALQSQQAGAKPRSGGAAAAGVSAPGSSACNFCGGLGHFIRECEVVAEYTKAGKCKRGADGKVVLPSGAMVPRDISGAWLRDRVDEWHRRNPGQMAAQMLFEVTALATAPSHDAACRSYFSCPTKCANGCDEEISAKAYALDRRPRPRPEVVINSQPPRRTGRAGQGEDAGGAVSEAAPQTQRDKPPHMGQDTSAAKNGTNQEPTHPYATVPDATNGMVPGVARPAAREPAAGRADAAYSNAAKIYDPAIAQAIYERAMEAPITVTQRELLSLAPEVRARVADVTLKKRLPKEPVVQAMIEEIPDLEKEKQTSEPTPRQKRLEEHAAHMPAAYAATVRALPADATVIADPYEAYLRANGSNPAESGIAVAAESNALRAILPVIDGQDRVEAILDPGCQIVAMSEEVCNALALPYDPTIRLNMMSANGGVDQSLGLARNVPFLVGDITLYLQVHVLRAPAYDILLGRPFDVLTRSVVCNFADENQTITIIDPNSGRKATVPTIPRGSFRFAERRAHGLKCPKHQQDF